VTTHSGVKDPEGADSETVAEPAPDVAPATTALEALRSALHARSIRSAQAASDDPASAPVRAAWIID
jgi:hypothetical protein